MKHLLIIACALLFACTKPPTNQPPATEQNQTTIRAMALPKNNAAMLESLRFESLFNYSNTNASIVRYGLPEKIFVDNNTSNQLYTQQIQTDTSLNLNFTLNKGYYNWVLYFCQYPSYAFAKADSTIINLHFYQKINGQYKAFRKPSNIIFTQKDILKPFWWSGHGLHILEDGTELGIIIKADSQNTYKTAHLCALEILPQTQDFFYFQHTKIQLDKDGNVLGLAIEKPK